MKDWEAAYINDNTPWDKGTAAPPLLEWLATNSISGRVLVPGCGTGHDVRLLAKQGADVVGMDISPSALCRAERLSKMGKVSYAICDFLKLGSQWHGQFDTVVEHTCLCALELDQRKAYVASVLSALKPRGYYLAIFFREVSNYDNGGPPHPISDAEIDSLFGDSFQRLDSFIPTETYPCRPYGSEEVVLFRKR